MSINLKTWSTGINLDTFSKTLTPYKRLWDLDFNPSKCQVLHVCKSKHPAQHIYMLHGQALEAMDHVKHLGVNISKDVSWNTQINRISTNANRTLGFLKRNIKTKNTAIGTAAYQTLVCPEVEYTATVWSPFNHTYINRLKWSKEGPCAGSTATIPHMPVWAVFLTP